MATDATALQTAQRARRGRRRVELRALPHRHRPVLPRLGAARPRPRVRRAPQRPAPLARRELPGADGLRRRALVHRLPRAAHADDGPDEGRLSLRPRRLDGRVRGAGDVDDVEVRAARPALRRREGRRALRAERAERRRARAPDAPLRRRADPDHRPREGHPRAGHGDERARDGVVHGHVLPADRPLRAGRRHRQADRARRHRRAARGDRPRRRLRARGRLRPHRAAAARVARRDPGLRQRRRRRGARAVRDRRDGRRGLRSQRRARLAPPGWTSSRSRTGSPSTARSRASRTPTTSGRRTCSRSRARS